ncbi:MAG: site-2 protease family protein [Gemmatimonadetes bacterium]|nr:site-2 protease family protein [Gemmatimonadota bacterium]
MEWLLSIPVLLFSIVLHEVAHGWVARREGDDTAERLGRITLNPIVHLDPVGSILVPAILAFLPGGRIFGWAKPVPVNPGNFRDPLWSDIRVSMAGITMNLLLAVFFTLTLVPMAYLADMVDRSELLRTAMSVSFFGVYINLVLAIFNLVPIPPLDGSHVMRHLLPKSLRAPYQAVGQFGLLILIAITFLVPGGFNAILVPVDYLKEFLFSSFGLTGRV